MTWSTLLFYRLVITIKKGVFLISLFFISRHNQVQTGIVYNYYFEVFDNDALHGFKRSSVFSTRISTEEENIVQIFWSTIRHNIKGLQQSFKKSIITLDKLQKLGREKNLAMLSSKREGFHHSKISRTKWCGILLINWRRIQAKGYCHKDEFKEGY
jgi:hypothetical protein